MKPFFRILSGISLAACIVFAFRTCEMFAPGEYNEFTPIVAMRPAMGCVITILVAVIFFGVSFFVRTDSEQLAGPETPEAEQATDRKPDHGAFRVMQQFLTNCLLHTSSLMPSVNYESTRS